ncbi:hypothetical protein [Azospirillum sp. sgz302134]
MTAKIKWRHRFRDARANRGNELIRKALSNKRLNGRDWHVKIAKRGGVEIGYFFDVFDTWLRSCLEHEQKWILNGADPTEFDRRLFYSDAMFDEIMVRFTKVIYKGERISSVCLAKIYIEHKWRNQGVFERVIEYLENESFANNLGMEVESARESLSLFLSKRGYLPESRSPAPRSLLPIDKNSWLKPVGGNTSGVALVIIPPDILKAIGGGGIFTPITLSPATVNEEFEQLWHNLRNRIVSEDGAGN